MDRFDIIIIGSGPGGYVCAIRAAQLGLKTAIIEKSDLGGVCLNWGCIPSKALLRNAEVANLISRSSDFGITIENIHLDYGIGLERSRKVVNQLVRGVDYLLKKNKITRFTGEGKIIDANTVEITDQNTRIEGENIVIATGAKPRNLPEISIDGKTVMTSREALEQPELPESIVIIGGGAIGCEFAYIYNSYNVDVTLIEILPQLLPKEDPEIADYLKKSFIRHGINVKTGISIQDIQIKKSGKTKVSITLDENSETINTQAALLAIGIEANTENIGLDKLGIQISNGYISINDYMQTTIPNIFAIGDVTGKLPLAHVASEQGVWVAEFIAGQKKDTLEYSLMPRAVYCQPQVASWGLTEEEAKESGYEVEIGKFPFNANGKALGLGEADGFTKIITDAKYGQILGCHMIGSEVTELLGELSMARTLEGTSEEIASVVHAHPSLSEVLKEAALSVQNRAIHGA
ncbi:MAG: dihydrolipoyl dehydrogenase [Chloroflexi bacterium]|nr:dihydrolipoyl dehydrogenase [Chloroflexota bacterium]|tara:strand:- start:11084 stop:12472 length:1389 start_codon:yes stop_codon:yes gene_type:complete